MRAALRNASRAGRPLFPLLLALASAVGCGTPVVLKDMPPADVEIQFTESALEPTVAQVPAGGNVVWVSEATDYTGAVLFPASIASAFTCSELRPLFSEVDAGYLSQPISGMVENVKLPCPLAAGTYDYQLLLYEPNFGGPDDPVITLKGSLVVR